LPARLSPNNSFAEKPRWCMPGGSSASGLSRSVQGARIVRHDPNESRAMTAPTDQLTIGELVGRVEHVHVSCAKCGRSGRYPVAKLIAERGPALSLSSLKPLLTKDCPRKGEDCAAVYQDFPKGV
jgi:hypothetical protein